MGRWAMRARAASAFAFALAELTGLDWTAA